MIEASILKATYLGVGLSDTQLVSLSKIAEVQNFISGHVLTSIGDIADQMFVVLSGELRVTTHDNDTLGEIKAGNIVGEIALIDTHPRTVNVVCCGPVTVAAFHVNTLRQAIMADKDAGIHILANIARVLAMRLRAADYKIDHLSDRAEDSWAHTID